MTKDELKEHLRVGMRWHGAFDVAKLVAEVATESSKEYKDAGNDGAVIHRDARSLNECVEGMVNNHMLRQLAYAR